MKTVFTDITAPSSTKLGTSRLGAFTSLPGSSRGGDNDMNILHGNPAIDPSKIELGRQLGSGTFGQVFAASINQTPCAVKMLHQQDQLTPEQQEELMKELGNEVVALSTAHHPNIIGFMGISTHSNGRLMIVTEKMTTDLYSLLVNTESPWYRNKFSVVTRIGFGRDAALAMAWLHGRDPVYLHLDLKPANILVDPEKKTVKVCDFGGTIIKAAHQNNTGTLLLIPF